MFRGLNNSLTHPTHHGCECKGRTVKVPCSITRKTEKKVLSLLFSIPTNIHLATCSNLKVITSRKLTGSGTNRRCGFIGESLSL